MKSCLSNNCHSLLHNIHKHWKTISIISLLTISALGYNPSINASHTNSIHVNYTKISNNQRRTFSKGISQTNVKRNKQHPKMRVENSSYITPDNAHREHYFTNQDLNYLKRNSATNYTNHLESMHLPHRIFTKIYKRSTIVGYHFDLVQFSPKHRGWVINTDLSHYRNHIHNNEMISDFFKRLYKQYLFRYYTHDQALQILSNQAQFNKLEDKENTTRDESSLANLRHEEIDWLNFYRQNLYHEHKVTENNSYNNTAQIDAKEDKDPEDMDWGSYAPHDAVFDYLTDANDVDDDGTTGHRYSILRPNSNQVGVGQYGDRNTVFFDWGLHNNKDKNMQINYPTANIFPTEYAQNGEYWSYQLMTNKSIKRAKVQVRDKTLNDKLLKVSNQHIKNNIIYYKVNKDALRNHHLYKIEIKIPHHKIIYTVRLYNLIQDY